jgi:hypothetical protein
MAFDVSTVSVLVECKYRKIHGINVCAIDNNSLTTRKPFVLIIVRRFVKDEDVVLQSNAWQA